MVTQHGAGGVVREKLLERTRSRLKQHAFPAHAVTFHLSVWPHGSLEAPAVDEAGALIERHGLDCLYVGHGNAIRVDGRVVVLTGPAGIGKSTAGTCLEREGRATTIEDGVFLLGESSRRWHLIETGTLAVLRNSSVVRGWLRVLLGLHDSVYFEPAGRWVGARSLLRRYLVELPAFHAAVLFTRTGTQLRERVLPVRAAVVVTHPRCPPDWFRIGPEGKVEQIRDVASVAPDDVEVTRLDCSGVSAEVRVSILCALRTLVTSPRSRLQ